MRNDRSTLKSTGIALIAIAGFLVAFLTKVVKAGRLPELFISFPFLILGYFLSLKTMEFLSSSINMIGVAFFLTFPLGVYALYWLWLFSQEKVTSTRANLNWADRNWWWTLDGWEFEEEVARIFRLNGYKAKVTKKTGDGGIDIILYKDNLKYIVQCKHYKNSVGPEPVRALWGVKDDFGADRVILVASSGITEQSKMYIKNKPLYSVLTLEDIISMGLRPQEDSEDEIVCLETNDVIEAKVIDNSKNEYPPFFPLD